MATGIEMLNAVRGAIKGLPIGHELRLSPFDIYDLFKLTADDLVRAQFSDLDAKKIDAELLQGKLDTLGACLGVRLMKDKDQKNLIPGEGIRRTAGIWANEESMTYPLPDVRNPSAG